MYCAGEKNTASFLLFTTCKYVQLFVLAARTSEKGLACGGGVVAVRIIIASFDVAPRWKVEAIIIPVRRDGRASKRATLIALRAHPPS